MDETEKRGDLTDVLDGPYKPTWKIRRRLVFVVLTYVAVMLPVFIFFAPVTAPLEITVYGLFTLALMVLSYYLIGPSIELVKLALAWRR